MGEDALFLKKPDIDFPGGGDSHVDGYQVPVNRPPFYTNLRPNDPPFSSVQTQ